MFAGLRKRRERFSSHELVPPLLAAAGIGATIVYDQYFDIATGPILCLFRRITALPCPGCGLTRSVVTLGNGDLVGAFEHHPLGILFVAVLCAVIGSWMIGLARNRPPRPVVTSRLVTLTLIGFAVHWALQLW
ncbi:MAG: hypothetical protein ACJAYU_003828 [Bradymonadia bacterium]|jgi:hypothetical protein